MPVIKQSELPWSSIAHELVGEEHGGIALCIIFVDAEPGRGPGLHTHPYDEVLIIQEGRASVTVGDEHIEVGAGDIVLIPADTPHAFTNTGDGNLRQIDIHASPRFATEWLAANET
jgi:mannose-6-phosphate isomerase-like protein (cupin superfamily)